MPDDNNSDSPWGDEGAEYSPKSEFSKPKVVEDATRKCFELRAKEMKKGYYNTRFTKEGLPLKVWIEDSRKAYCSAVMALKHLLTPEILADIQNFKDNQKKQKQDQKKLGKGYKHIKLGSLLSQYSCYLYEKKIVKDKITYVRTNKYFMPDMDEAVYVRKIFPDGNEQLERVEGIWNSKVNSYWDSMVKRSDLVFDELMKVIHRLNYFKQSIRMG